MRGDVGGYKKLGTLRPHQSGKRLQLPSICTNRLVADEGSERVRYGIRYGMTVREAEQG